MFTILIAALCLLIVASAMGADRSARASRRWRAVGLNLCGIGCLALGLIAIFAWSRGGIAVTQQLAAVDPAGHPATVVRLLVDQDGGLKHRASSDTLLAEKEPVDVVQVSVAGDSSQPATVRTLAESDIRPSNSPVLPAEAADLNELEAWAEEGLESTQPDDVLDPELRSRVEIDFDARPAWVEQTDSDVGGVHQIAVNSGPYRTQRKARKELYKLLQTATNEYINQVVGNPNAARWVNYSEQRVRHGFVNSDNFFDEKVVSPSVGVMYQSHALLEFGPAFHDDVEQAWRQVVARAQLVKVTLAGGAVLGILVLLFGYFNADTATRGFYSGRLKFVTAVAILGTVAAGFFLARSIPWLWL